ncbi:DUF3289 family protein [Chryseobacterium caseinilyticum]|uniref:DUF3289 family protein n=1 Tax=Chryseobacterium caseinilyticum TaxID=2771428 RepID=A0ABR8ZBB2_9FLAO|nr:DUF3289 family protein [Chryseobacterium caseinilyticum]MBD8082195.1 DUF3289 family protein [Chryseobacterium caseinilyticum]
MSRTRIVQGKIHESTGELSYFSKSGISENAAMQYAENSAASIHEAGNPETPPKPEEKTYNYPILILQGSRRKGRNRDNSGTATDMLFNDYTSDEAGYQRLRTQLYNETYNTEKQDGWLDWSSRNDNASGDADFRINKIKEYNAKSADDLFKIFKGDIGYFSMGKIQTVAELMVERMRENTGADFTHTDLTKAVIAHQNSINFIAAIHSNIRDYLRENQGEISGLEIKNDGKGILYEMLVEDNVSSPRFSDKFSGLGITINDVWAYQVFIKKYTKTNHHYQMELQYIYWDHFGLDYPDIQKYDNNIFFAWFVLQHFKGYKPFITKIDMKGTISGFV